jgi:hypothetical protein
VNVEDFQAQQTPISAERSIAHLRDHRTISPEKFSQRRTLFRQPVRLRTLKTVSSESAASLEVQSLIGLNTNLTLGNQVLHVQTEDLGRQRASIVTHVFSKDWRVIQKVRFDYSQHLGHPNLLGILPRAMRAQHTAVMQRLRKEGPEPATNISQTDLPCFSEPTPTPSPDVAKPVSKQRPRLDPGTWDRLVAKAKAEREREREAAPAVPLPEANAEPNEMKPLSQHEKPETPRTHQWEAAIASARREFESTPAPEHTPATASELEARRHFDKAKAQLQLGEWEAALVLLCKAVSLDFRNPGYRRQLSRVLERMGGE